MKVKDLINELQGCDPELKVFMWIDGSRYPITLLEDMEDCVDLNASQHPITFAWQCEEEEK